MRHLCLSVAMMGCALVAGAQIVNVKSIEKINVPFSVSDAVISPDGLTVIANPNEDNSLMKVNLADAKSVKIADNGSTYLLTFTDDSKSIAYVEHTEDANHLRYKAVKSIALEKPAEVKTLQAATRTLNGVGQRAGKMMVVNDAKMQANKISGSKMQKVAAKDAAPVPYIYYGQLWLDINGETRELNPLGYTGCESYIWPSLSPDGTKVLFYMVGAGAHVCDLDGSNVRRIADLRAPRWLDDNTIVAMRDQDDGKFFTASTIVVADLNGNTQDITSDDKIAMFPTASADAARIAFTTPQGELYVINLDK